MDRQEHPINQEIVEAATKDLLKLVETRELLLSPARAYRNLNRIRIAVRHLSRDSHLAHQAPITTLRTWINDEKQQRPGSPSLAAMEVITNTIAKENEIHDWNQLKMVLDAYWNAANDLLSEDTMKRLDYLTELFIGYFFPNPTNVPERVKGIQTLFLHLLEQTCEAVKDLDDGIPENPSTTWTKCFISKAYKLQNPERGHGFITAWINITDPRKFKNVESFFRDLHPDFLIEAIGKKRKTRKK